MAETAEEYKARLRKYAAGKDPIEMQRQAPRLLELLIDGVPRDTLARRLGPDRWSVLEILGHLADGEVVSAWRYRQIVERDGVTLSAYDQDVWTRLGDYGSANPEELLETFRLLREANLRMLGRLKPEEWEHFGMHEERGRTTLRELVVHVAGHDRNHIDQIRAILMRSEQ
jgi:hypothetical protein